MIKPKKITFNNNLRLITVPFKNSNAVTVLVLAGVGSKYESKKISGISHFLEHMYFKGTKKRPNHKAVSETMDKIGGSFNAFTGDEYTGYYAKVAASKFDTALDWVSDIFLNSTLPEKEIIKEKNVIIEEINMINDHPMKNVQELWMNLLYKDQPAGWNIAGTKKSVLGIGRQDLINYMKKGYSSSNTLVCIAGNVDEKDVEEKIKKYFSNIKKGKKPNKKLVVENQRKPEIIIKEKETDQAHICLGVRTHDIFHKDRYILKVIETILGKMMSSRMFVKIREDLGLAYYIRTEVDATTDTGFLVTQAGVDIRKVKKAVSAIVKEYYKISQKKVSLSELRKAKDNIKGRTVLSLESSDSQAFFYGAQELLEEKIETPEEIFKKIDKVTVDDILRVSNNIFKNNKLNLVVLGPVKEKKEFEKILKLK